MTLPQGTIFAGPSALIHLDGSTSEDMAFLPDAAMTLLGRSGPYRVH
jgi:hypothetical protein